MAPLDHGLLLETMCSHLSATDVKTNRLEIAFSHSLEFFFYSVCLARWVRVRLQIDAFNDTNWYTKWFFRVEAFFLSIFF